LCVREVDEVVIVTPIQVVDFSGMSSLTLQLCKAEVIPYRLDVNIVLVCDRNQMTTN